MSFCLSRELPHCCKDKPLPGEQEGSSRAKELMGQAGGVCVHLHGLWWWGLPVTVRPTHSPFAITADSIKDVIKRSMWPHSFLLFVWVFSPLIWTSEREMHQWEVGVPA